MKKIEPRLPKGFRDMTQSDMIVRNQILDIVTEIFTRFGYEPIETPALEYWEVLTGKYGQEAERLVYHLEDRGGRSLGLRYDLTVPLARYIAGNKHLLKPFKRYQIQPVWRAEKPQKGRYREFYQCDIDVIGPESMLVDAELIHMTIEIMTLLGFEHFEVRVNNRKILQGIVRFAGLEAERTADVCQSLDKVDKIGWENVEKELLTKGYDHEAVSKLALARDLTGDNVTILNQLEEKLGHIDIAQEGIDELRTILRFLEAMHTPAERCRITPLLTRGLDYYTGPIYETFLTNIAFSSLGGGGRYNGLVGIFSSEEIPAAGTSFGLDRIAAAMEELGMGRDSGTVTDVLVVQFSGESCEDSLRLATQCREAKIKTDIYYDAAKLKKQFSYAHNKGIPIVLVRGPSEIENDTVQVKEMKNGEQLTVPRAELISVLEEKLKSGK